MAGHSKWANIQHRKKAQDARRGKLFTKLLREITVAARLGGGDTDANPRLRLAVEKATAANVNKDNIRRSIQRGVGELDGVVYENVSYEGYGPGAAAVLVECTTDNKNRTVAEVRHVFNRHGGNLGAAGSVLYLFKQRGVLRYPPGCDEDAVIEAAIAAGADDVASDADGLCVIVAPQRLLETRQAMQRAGLAPNDDAVEMAPVSIVPLGADDADKLARLLEALEALDDVQDVYCNAAFPDERRDGVPDEAPDKRPGAPG